VPTTAGHPQARLAYSLSALPRPHPGRAARLLTARVSGFYRRDRPVIFVIGACGFLLAVLVADWLPWGVGGWLNRLDQRHQVAVALIEHVIVAIAAAAAAYYLLYGLKARWAIRDYLRLAIESPEKLIEWSDAKPAVVRGTRVKLFAESVAHTPSPTVGVVYGRTGTGRPSFLVRLVEELAKRRVIPIPVRANRDGSVDLQTDARRAFCHRVDLHVSSGESEAIWQRARAFRMAIILDGVDDETVDQILEGERLKAAFEELLDDGISVILVTTRQPELGGMVTLREDLDRYTRAEAEKYVEKEVRDECRAGALTAVRRLRDPVDEALVAPFYLELMAGLRLPLGELPQDRDRWRATVLGFYLDALSRGFAMQPNRPCEDNQIELARRGCAAMRAAVATARAMEIEEGAVAAHVGHLQGVDERDIKHAIDFGLLWRGDNNVGFIADDLGAFVIGRSLASADPLLEAIERVAQRQDEHGRNDRYPIMALIFWTMCHSGREAHEVFEKLVRNIFAHRWRRPSVVAAAIRIATSCDMDLHVGPLRTCAERSIDSVEGMQPSHRLEEITSDQALQDMHHDHHHEWYRDELIKLVRALAEWRDPNAHRVLWRLSRATSTGLDWAAAKALAMASGDPGHTLGAMIDRTLLEAGKRSNTRTLSVEDDELGTRVAALAWILPALRETLPQQYEHVRDLCLSRGVSPLRGEMSLAQGLKHAVINDRCAVLNLQDMRSLLFAEPGSGLRFWHARILLAQGLLAHLWLHGEDRAAEAEDLDTRLSSLETAERHHLVRHAIRHIRDALERVDRPDTKDELDRYVWIHEKEAVSWVAAAKEKLSQLAADAVLLSNMTYELRATHPEEADRAAKLDTLPACIRNPRQRHRIAEGGCSCDHGICTTTKAPTQNMRVPFAESFCREQVRLTQQEGRPPWVKPSPFGEAHLSHFWEEQAGELAAAQRNG
jgi:hypothetical protein